MKPSETAALRAANYQRNISTLGKALLLLAMVSFTVGAGLFGSSAVPAIASVFEWLGVLLFVYGLTLKLTAAWDIPYVMMLGYELMVDHAAEKAAEQALQKYRGNPANIDDKTIEKYAKKYGKQIALSAFKYFEIWHIATLLWFSIGFTVLAATVIGIYIFVPIPLKANFLSGLYNGVLSLGITVGIFYLGQYFLLNPKRNSWRTLPSGELQIAVADPLSVPNTTKFELPEIEKRYEVLQIIIWLVLAMLILSFADAMELLVSLLSSVH